MRMRLGPWPRAARARTKLSVNLASASAPDCSSPSSAAAAMSLGYPRARRFCASSKRVCSRRARRSRACRVQAAWSVGASGLFDGLELIFVFGRFRNDFLRQQPLAYLRLYCGGDIGMLNQLAARILLALADALPLVAEPGTGFLDDVVFAAEVDDLAFTRDAVAIENLELRGPERRRHFVLDDLDARLVAQDFLAFLDGSRAACAEPHRGIELERVAARRRLRIAEHDADLHADLVDEDDEAIRALNVAGELAQRLRHQTRLETDVRIAHLAFDFGFRRQGGDRIDDHDVDGARPHEHVGDLERLLARVGLRDQEIVELDADFLGVYGVDRMLSVDDRRRPAVLLHLGHDLQSQRRLTRGFGPVDFDDAAARQAAHA